MDDVKMQLMGFKIYTLKAFDDFRGYLTALKPPPLLTTILILAVLKLVLITNHEIIAANRPHDDYWHLAAAQVWVWGRPFDEWALLQLPVYALFIALNHLTGVPLRLTTELLFLSGSGVLVYALGRLGLARSIIPVVFAFLAFHPFMFDALDYSLAEVFYTCLLPFFFGFFIRILVPVNELELRRSVVIFAVLSALLWHSRKESVLIAGLFIFIVCFLLLMRFRRQIDWPRVARLLMRLVVIPVIAVVITGVFIVSANGLKYGFWGIDLLRGANFVRAYSALQRIQSNEPLRFIPVSKSARELAYKVSPAFRELQPILDGPVLHWTVAETQKFYNFHGEIAAGWFYWALIDGARAAGHYKTASEGDAFFGRVADEISAALADGRLPSRRVWIPFLDPNISLWGPYVGSSFIQILGETLPSAATRFPERYTKIDWEKIELVNAMANRRVNKEIDEKYDVQGWVLGQDQQIRSIQIESIAEVNVTEPQGALSRPDVKQVFPLVKSEAVGFDLTWARDYMGLDGFRYKISFEDGRVIRTNPLSMIGSNNITAITSSETDLNAFLMIDRAILPPSAFNQSAITLIEEWYPILLLLFTIGAFLHWFIIVVVPRRSVDFAQAFVILFVLAAALSRLLFFAILDASAWSAEQTRYVLPVVILMPIFPGLLMTLGRMKTVNYRQNKTVL